MLDQLGLLLADLVNALQRIAVALEELVALKQVEVEATVMKPDNDDDEEPARAGCGW